MAQLLCSKYIPRETLVTRSDSNSIKELILKYKSEKITDGYYKFTKPAVLEMVFREGERDFVFSDMLDAMSKYIYSKRKEGKEKEIYDMTIEKFVRLIATGKIKVTILPDGSYTLK